VGLAEGGGIDLLNTEASALLQWPGLHGTEGAWTTTSRTLAETSPAPLIQPGTIGFSNDAYCTRYDPASSLANDAGLIRLPGCRGISQLLTRDLPNLPAGAPIEFLFEAGFDPKVDGCMLGVSNPSNAASRGVGIAGHPVRALRIRAKDDPGYDPSDPVGSAEDITAFLDVTCGGRGAAGTASATRIGTAGYATDSQYRTFAQTAWHPLAGCKTWEQARDPSDAVRRCDFTTRNFEQEFLDGTAQIFRSELAAVSWNFLMFLVVTSCDSARGGDDLADPECFDPRLPAIDAGGNPIGNAAWAPDRCSLAAPQYCRNVQILLELSLDENRNGIPDVLDDLVVGIDIKPGSDENPVNPFSRGRIPVAILGSEGVDVRRVDARTLRFGPSEAPPADKKGGSLKDVNGDGWLDLVSHYRTEQSGIAVGDTQACVTGEIDGEAFEGCDRVRTVPACGLGFEVVLLLAPFLLARRLRR
jgi:hypothetical protein